VHVMICGLARSLSICVPSINEKIIGSLARAPGIDVTWSFVLSYTNSPLNNPRTSETSPAQIDLDETTAENAALFELEDLRSRTSDLYSRILGFGEWIGGSGRNLRNYLEFLSLLKIAGEEMLEGDSDAVLFVRPDVFVLDRFIPIPGLTISKQAVLTPSWGKFNGLNDRMAFVPRQHLPDYFFRLDSAEVFAQQIGPMDPEKHLKWALRNVPSRATIGTELVRIRAGGFPEKRDLERLRTSHPIRKLQEKQLRSKLPVA